MSNNIKTWYPKLDEKFPNSIVIDGIHDDYEGFRILVRGGEPSKVYRISFGFDYLGYRNFDESERLRTIPDFPKNSREWCLFKSDESSFIDWMVHESKGIHSLDEITHFYIATSNVYWKFYH